MFGASAATVASVAASAVSAGTGIAGAMSGGGGKASNAGFLAAKQALEAGRDQARSDLEPYSQAGKSALDELAWQLGINYQRPREPISVPTTYQNGQTNDPIWEKILADFNTEHRNNFGIPMNRSWDADADAQNVYRILSERYRDAYAKANPQVPYQGVGEKGNLLKDFDMEAYKKDPGYTPMVNSLEELQATPGYQFQLEQGLQSVNNSAAAKGSLLSGNNIKAINNFAQGQAATGYQAAWERAQQAYQNAYNRDTTNKNNRFGRLQSLTNSGQQAATSQGNASLAVGQGLAGVAQNQGISNANQAIYQGQQAQNAITGVGNALTSALTNPGVQNSLSSWFGGGGGNAGGGYTNDALIGAKVNAFL